MMDCGCPEGYHVGPGCPIYRGGPPKFMVNCILQVTQMERGILQMRASNSRWFPLTKPDHYDFLNQSLAAYRLEYESSTHKPSSRSDSP